MKNLLRFMLAPLLVAAPLYALQPQIGDISDNRTTGHFFKGLEVEVKLIGDELQDAVAAKVQVAKAVDESGRDLIDPEQVQKEYETLGSMGNSGNSVKLKFNNPTRKSLNIKDLSGTVNLFVPKNDPQSTVSIPLSQGGGKPVSAPALQAHKIELTVMTNAQHEAKQKAETEAKKKEALAQGVPAEMVEQMGAMFGGFGDDGNKSLYLSVNDPESRLVGFKLYDEAGKEISGAGSMYSGNSRTLYFSDEIPANAKFEIQVATAKSLVSVPFQFTNVALP